MQEVGEYEKAGSSVREYAYSEDKNYKFRPQMEDSKNTFNKVLAYIIKDKMANDPNCGFFAVFDGHGGR